MGPATPTRTCALAALANVSAAPRATVPNSSFFMETFSLFFEDNPVPLEWNRPGACRRREAQSCAFSWRCHASSS
jgi:hypothetical protein